MDETQPQQSQDVILAEKAEGPLTHKSSECSGEKLGETSNPGGSGDGVVYPPMCEVIPIILALSSTIFLTSLDRSIIATAIPRITDEFNSLGDVGWYGSAYMLASSALMLLFGKIYTFYSPKYVLLMAIGLFEIGSTICGAALSSLAFIIGRAIAGWGSSGMFTGAVVTFQHILPLHKRPIAMGMMGAVFGISSVAGPLIRGALTDKASWRWCFYINLPIGAFAMLILVLVLKVSSPARPGVSCLLLALQWGDSKYAWNDVRIIVFLVIAGILIIAFMGIQVWKYETATIPPRIFMQRSIIAGFGYSLCNGAALFVMIYYLPQWFQAVKGVDPVQSGINTLPLLTALTIAAIIAGITVSKIGYYVPPMLGGSIFMSIGAGLITTFQPNTGTPIWIGYQILFGFGAGAGMQQASVAAQTVLALQDVAIGSALMMLGQQLSGAIFVSIAQTIFINCLVSGLSDVAGLDPLDIVNMGANDITANVPSELLDVVLLAYNNALTGPFTVAVAMVSFAITPALSME